MSDSSHTPPTSADSQQRLNDIWSAWTLAPDVDSAEVQHAALGAAAGWLQEASRDPAIAIRAVQVLLLDPESTSGSSRASWQVLRNILLPTWKNIGTAFDHILYGQALLVAAWPEVAPVGHLALAGLLDSSWDAIVGRPRQRPQLEEWRLRARDLRAVHTTAVADVSDLNVDLAEQSVLDALEVAKAAAATFQNAGPQVYELLRDHDAAVDALVDKQRESISAQRALAERIAQQSAQLEVLWWGQARYCKRRKTPYARLSDQPDTLLWLATTELAAVAADLEPEPVAAYLANVLELVGQRPDHKKTLRAWMDGLHGALRTESQPMLSPGLEHLVQEDPLGLPVSLVRRHAARGEIPSDGYARVALDLSVEIDRAQWASWVYREVVLDTKLASGT